MHKSGLQIMLNVLWKTCALSPLLNDECLTWFAWFVTGFTQNKNLHFKFLLFISPISFLTDTIEDFVFDGSVSVNAPVKEPRRGKEQLKSAFLETNRRKLHSASKLRGCTCFWCKKNWQAWSNYLVVVYLIY